MRYSEAAIFSGHASLFSQTLMALCAFAMIPSMMAVAWIAYAEQHGFLLQADPHMSVIAVAGICAAYCLDRLLDPDPRLQQVYASGLRWMLLFVCIAAALYALFVWFQSGWNNIVWLALCVTWASGHVFGKSIPGAKNYLCNVSLGDRVFCATADAVLPVFGCEPCLSFRLMAHVICVIMRAL